MKKFLALLCILCITPAFGTTKVLYGGVNHTRIRGHVLRMDKNLKLEEATQDHRAPLPAKVEQTHLRGYLGVRFDPKTGQLLAIAATSDLRRTGIHEGAFILKIDQFDYRPCQMPNVSMRMKGDYVILTIQQDGQIIKVIAQLKDAKTLFGYDVPESEVKACGTKPGQ